MADQIIFDGETFLDGLENFDGPDDSMLWNSGFPMFQYNQQFYQEFEFPLKHWAGSNIEVNYRLEDVRHDVGKKEPGFLVPEVEIVVIAMNPETWELRVGDEKIYSDRPDFENNSKWIRRYLFLCLVKQAESLEPAILTVGGHIGKFTYRAIEQGRKRTLALVKKLTGRQYPGYLFWTKLAAGPPQEVGKEKKKMIVPPATVIPDVSGMEKPEILDLLKDLYVGDEIKDLFINGLFEEGQQWALDKTAQLSLPPGPVRTNGPSAGQAVLESTTIEVISGDELYIPNLSTGTRQDWIESAMSLPDLFANEGKANTAFNSVMRKAGLKGPTSPQQWEAWREEIQSRWSQKVQKEQDEATEQALR